MKVMVRWTIGPATYKEAVAEFLATGAPVPEGVTSLGRWHSPGSSEGWHLVEGDAGAMAQLSAQWGHLIHLEMSPVITDEEAAAALSAVHGS